MYRALKLARLAPGDWVAITGAGGGLGHLGVQFAKAMSYKVIAIDSGPEKQAVCQRFGADYFIDFNTTADVVREVTATTGGGADTVIASAATKSSYIQATSMVATGGSLLCIGLPPEKFDLPISIADCIGRSCHIIGVNAGSLRETEEALEYAAQHNIQVLTQVFPMAEAEEVFRLVAAGKVVGRAVLDLEA
ncbi:hypothetical protein H2200_012812 [Cladophialophora chaetospira]|uniref:Alcohol dehydrogenase-like C-terminal domain-containing protein n=1 Tax=Cladophialophora chaetospira TaxID=386627 RepID=A0AA38WWV8_9EURO|nr:hypothetical protein H2200_012812 [Cladophialophora chaetospira]